MVKNRTFFLAGLILVLVLNIVINQGVIEGYKPELDIHRPYLGEQTNGGIMNPEKEQSDELSLVNSNPNLDKLHKSVNEIMAYETRNPISILNDSAFGPAGYNFPGSGTIGAPYLIDGYNITDSSGTLIYIENTTVFFVIQDCLLDGISKAHTGIYLKNVTQGTICNNVMINNADSCYLYNSRNNIIENNRMSNTSSSAIVLYYGSRYNSIIDNEIQNSHTGIYVGPYSSSSQIFRNTITDVALSGVSLKSDSSGGQVINNTLSNIGQYGVVLDWYTDGCKIIGNIISNTSLAGIRLAATNYGIGSIISNNTILNSKQQGIQLISTNRKASITRNTIFNCSGYGLEFNANSDNNEVKWNNFFHNNGGDIQAFDNGINNVFEYNHWNDHISPDVDVDGFVDTVYQIDSTGGLRLSGTTSSYMITNPVSTFASDNLTVELWMKSFDNSKSFSLVSYANVSANDFLLAYDTNANEIDIYVGGSVVNTGCALSENVWTHIVVTWQSSDGEITLWKDGILDYTGTLSTGLTFDTKGSLVLGQDQDNVGGGFGDGSQSFDGILDEVRILTSVLNQSEIQADNNSLGSYPARNGTIAWYHLDDTGTTAADSAGSVGSGTVVGGEWADGVILKNNFDLYPRVAPIWINNQSDFANFTSSGNGTTDDPYIIENCYFISNKTNLIEIYNTTAHFVIRNSILDGFNGSYPTILLDNVTNGRIESNTICNSNYGLYITGNSHNNTYTKNILFNGENGFILNNSNDNVLWGNTIYNISNNGIWLNSTSRYNTISENTISESNTSIYISNSNNNTLSENILSNCISYGIFLLNSDNNMILNNDFYNRNTSIYLSSSTNNEIKWNNFLHEYMLIRELNTWTDAKAACEALGGHLVTITNQAERDFIQDLLVENGNAPAWIGLTDVIQEDTENTGLAPYWVWVTDEPFIFNDWATFTPNDGLHASVDYVYTNPGWTQGTWNDHYNGAYDGNGYWYICEWEWNESFSHMVDNTGGNIISYNYWDNHTGSDGDLDGFIDDPYVISGGISQDLFPRMIHFPVVTIVSPTTQLYSSSGFSVELIGNTYDYWYYIEGEDSQNVTWTMNVDRIIATGTYTLHAYSNDSIGVITHDLVPFTVDATPPSVDITSPISKAYNTDRISLIYTISDGTVIIEINGVANTTAIPSGATSPFPAGPYNITFITEDSLGNIGITTVLFTVDLTPPMVTIDSPTPTSYTTGSITVSLSGDAEAYWYYITGVDGSNHTWTSAVSRSLTDGTYTLHVYGNDSAGNEAHESVTFTISIPTTTTTTTQESTSETTTTTSKSGSFPYFLLIAISLSLAVVIRRRKKK